MSLVSINALLRVARSGLMAQETNISVIANNLANTNTIGFKESRAEFQELLDVEWEEPPEGSNRNAGQAAGTYLAAIQQLFEQGPIEASDFQWDMAIEGDGFFRVQLPDGSLAYTRDGSFRLDSEGRLTTADGYFLQPSFSLPPDTEEATVTTTGEVLVRRTGESEPYVLAQITLSRFANPNGLENIGDDLFQPTDASGPATLGPAGNHGFGQIIGHALEKSNVNVSRQMVDMITTQRAYTLLTRVIQTSDEMLGMAVHLRS
jgi:flagellar basal-body rod protein FlgG